MNLNDHKKQFGTEAENYTRYRRDYERAVFERIYELAQGPVVDVLDIACGTGKSTEPLARAGVHLCGCDHDPLMVAEAASQAVKHGLTIDYSVGSAEQLPYPDVSFDIVTVGTAFHWFVNSDAMTEIQRVLRPGGMCAVYWVMTTKEIPEIDQIPADIFRRYGCEPVPQHLRDMSYISEFFAREGLQSVGSARYEYEYQATVADRVGLQTTASWYGLLSDDDKQKFLDETQDILTKNLGEREYFTLPEEIQMCWGYKVG